MDRHRRAENGVRIASIDIGTNTVLLLIADIEGPQAINVLHHEQRLPRLGRDIDKSNHIHVSAFDRVAWILNEYKNIAIQFNSERIVTCGTSAVRDAANKAEFLSFLKSTTGIDVEVLSGDEEASLTYRGALSGTQSRSTTSVVIDIGGGSTEMSFPYPISHNGGSQLRRYSFQLGSVRITERYFKQNPPLPTELESARQNILEEIAQVINPGFHRYQLVGVAGTVTTLACLEQGLKEFDLPKVRGFTLTKSRAEFWCTSLLRMTVEEIRSLSDATDGRADILAAGTLILSEMMNHFAFESVIVSERGLRYGLVIREWERAQQARTAK